MTGHSTLRKYQLRRLVIALIIGALTLAPLPVGIPWAVGRQQVVGAAPRRATPVGMAQDDTSFCRAVPPSQGPKWSNLNNWNSEAYYSTIRLADLDGDLQAELMGRAGDGILVNYFNKATGRWVQRPNNSKLLSDGAGWNVPSNYRTIQYADIDGQPGAELVARADDGMLAWKYDPKADTWTQLPGVLSDGSAWDQPQYYSTIHLANLDGEPGDELFVRAKPGISAYKYDPKAGAWTPLAAPIVVNGQAYLADSEGGAAAEYWIPIQSADINGDGHAEIIGRGGVGLFALEYDPKAGSWSAQSFDGLFSDQSGFTQTSYLATIQFGDIDGEKGDELIARDTNGVETWKYDPSTITWSKQPTTVGLCDECGYTLEKFYRSIKLANIDSDKQMELIARDIGGLAMWDWNTATSSWTPVVKFGDVGRPLMDVGWSTPDTYPTIQTGDVDGDGDAEVLGRSNLQIETWKYDPSAQAFAPTLIFQFPQLNQTAYQYISSVLLVGGGNDIRSLYTDKDRASDFGGSYLTCLNSVDGFPCPNSQPPLKKPDNVPPDDWNYALTQLRTEFNYVSNVTGWFNSNDDYLTKMNSSDTVSVAAVAGKVQLSTQTDSTSLDVGLFITHLGISILEAIPDTAAVGAVLQVIDTAVEGGNALGSGSSSLPTTVNGLQTLLGDQFTNGIKANSCNLQFYMQDWALLQSLGEPIVQGKVTWDDTLTAQLLVTGRQQYEIFLWKTLTPLAWEIVTSAPNSPDCLRYGIGCDPVPAGYPSQYTYTHTSGGQSNWIGLQGDVVDPSAPDVQYLNDLFLPPPGLGVAVSDVFLNWNLPGNTASAGAVQSQPRDRCRATCLRAPEYYLNSLNRLPSGAVMIAGVSFNTPVSTGNLEAMRLALRGGASPLQRFNRQFVATQLSLLAAPGPDTGALQSRLGCYRNNFTGARLNQNVILGQGSTLDEAMAQARRVARNGSPTEVRLLSRILEQINGIDSSGRCGLGGGQ